LTVLAVGLITGCVSTQAQPATSRDLPLDWTQFDAVPILLGNHFLVQHQPDEFVITVGQSTGPPLPGPPQEAISVETLARIAVTRRRLTELIAVLQAALEDHDRVLGS
jgi:hypothetical protein